MALHMGGAVIDYAAMQETTAALDTTMPIRYYTDPAIWEIERREIFAKSWIMVCLEHEVREPSAYITEQIAGWEIFVWRDTEGQLRAFHNVCPHRGGPIVWDGQGCAQNLICRYHGWRFNADGSLAVARDFGAEPPADKSDLTDIRVQTWRGFVFVTLDPTLPDLIDWLGGFPAACEKYPIEELTYHSRTRRICAMNWKIYSDNYLEGYHLPLTHPGMSKELDSTKYRVHLNDDPRWNIHVAPAKEDSTWSGEWAYFFPNFSFNVFPQGIALERWLPRDVSTTELVFEYYFNNEVQDLDEAVQNSEDVADEDVRINAFVQRNMKSGAYVDGVISPRHEYALPIFTKLIRSLVDPHLANDTIDLADLSATDTNH